MQNLFTQLMEMDLQLTLSISYEIEGELNNEETFVHYAKGNWHLAG